eukprot:241620_1
MSSLFSFSNIDIDDAANYCVFYEDSCHPFSKSHSVNVTIGNTTYKSIEHYYQSQKFHSHSLLYQQILKAKTPHTATLLALTHQEKIRKDWNKVQFNIYHKGQKQKFIQHHALKQMLLETKQKPIICIDSDTFLGLQIQENKDNKQTLQGENNAGIILSTIRDELLLNDSEEEQKDEQKKTLIHGDVSQIFNKTYSAIFAPFLLNVVVRLLNNSKQMTLNIDDYVANWGGGIEQLRKCCIENELNPLDKQCNWDTLIDLCCVSTPSTHNAWIRLVKYNKIKVTNDPIQNLWNLLSRWKQNGKYHSMRGSYPTASEQEFYIQDTIPQEISEILNYAIMNGVFEDAFSAMQKCKAQEPSFLSSFWNIVDKSIASFIPFQ